MADLIKAPINYAVSAGGQFVKGGSVLFGYINIRPDAANPATLKPIYLDSGLLNQAANPQGLSSDAVFDQSDNGVLFGADDDSYSVIIYDANGEELSYIPVYQLSDATAAASAQAAEAGAIAAEGGAVTAQGLAEAAKVAAELAQAEAEAAALAAVGTLAEFQDIYWGAYASTPALSPAGNPAAEGDLYFNTTSSAMQVYNGSLWQATASAVTGVRNETTYTNSAGVSTFAIIYDLGFVDVYVNGVKLIQGVNYTAGTGTDITLTWPLAFATDTLQAVAYSTVEFGDFGTAAFIDTGTAAGQVPLNSDLGTASTLDVNAAGDVWGAGNIEYGTNANGEYWKYPDGLLICSHTTAAFLTTAAVAGGQNFNDITLTFPYPYITAPTGISTSVLGGTDFVWNGTHGAITTTSFSARLLGNTTAATGKVSYVVTGKWK